MTDEFNRALRRKEIFSLDAYSRHLKFIKDYKNYCDKAKVGTKLKSEADIARENCKFIMDEEEEAEVEESWEKRVAKKYYDKLFKEYALAELKNYKEGKIALRFRTKEEVYKGKGQFICGALKCDVQERLCSWEVHFAYIEDGKKKEALVKVRLCESCSYKLNYKKQARRVEKNKEEAEEYDETKKQRIEKKRKSEKDDADEDKKEENKTIKNQIVPENHSPLPKINNPEQQQSIDNEIDSFFEDLFK